MKSKYMLPNSVLVEIGKINMAWFRYCAMGIPLKIMQNVLFQSSYAQPFQLKNLKEKTGDGFLEFIHQLGPVYGKIFELILTNLSLEQQKIIFEFGFDRVSGKWPEMSFTIARRILDEDIPTWREYLTVDPVPLSVSAIAQFYNCVDVDGREWVMKIIKPHSQQRMFETIEVLEQFLSVLDKLEVGSTAKQISSEGFKLLDELKSENSLEVERDKIEKMCEKLRGKKSNVSNIPEVNAEFCSDRVLTIAKLDRWNQILMV